MKMNISTTKQHIITAATACILLVISLTTSAQVSIRGTATDKNNQPLAFVTILIRQDTSIRASTLTDAGGQFNLTVSASGTGTLIATLINYTPLELPVDFSKSLTLQLQLQRKTETLKGVTVIAKAPLIERKTDRLVVNVAQSISTSGSSFWELLTRAPGVTASNSGNISVMGKSTQVLIDGRATGVSGEDLAELLKTKQADQVEKIEIYTTPPARFDAQGGTVINIITKKRTTTGRDISFRSTYRQGYLARFSMGTAFNYSTPKLRLSGNYGFAPAKIRGTEDEYVRYVNTPAFSYWTMGHVRKVKAESNDFGLSGEYQVNKKQVLGFKVDGFFKYNRGNRTIFTDVRNVLNIVDSSLITSNLNSVKRDQLSANLNYRIITDSTGGLLEADFNHSQYNARTAQNIFTQGYDGAAQPKPVFFDIRSNAIQQIRFSSAQLRYARSFKKTDLEMGVKVTGSHTTNDLAFTQRSGAIYVNDPQRSNTFRYTENIQATYLSMTSHFPKTELQMGLRAEFTQTRGVSPTLQQATTRDYFRLFPTLFVQHTLVPNKHQLGLQYGRRINRPDYWRLNPFQFYTTPYAYLQGNPFLQPAFLHNTELNYTFKNAYTVAVFFNYTDNPFTNITTQDNASQLLLNNQVNLENNKEYGGYINLSKSIRPWWESTFFLQASHKEENTLLNNKLVTLRMWTAYINTVNSFTLSKKKGLRAEVTAWYSAPAVQGIYKLRSSNDISFTIRKSLWKNKGTLTVGVQDLLFGNFYRIAVNSPGQSNGFSGRNDTRTYSLNLTYRISRNKVTRIKDRKTGSEEEKQRLGNL